MSYVSTHSPSQTDQDALRETFVERWGLFEELVRSIKDAVSGGEPVRVLLYGQRGIGKSNLLEMLRLELEQLTKQGDLEGLRVASIPEDDIASSPYKLHRLVCRALAQKYENDVFLEGMTWTGKRQRDENEVDTFSSHLAEKLKGDQLLLLIENLDDLFNVFRRRPGKAKTPIGALRKYLEQPGINIIATSPRLPAGMTRTESRGSKGVRPSRKKTESHPFQDFFRRQRLQPLSRQGAHELVCKLAGLHGLHEATEEYLATPIGRERMDTIFHLSGGVHRVYILLSDLLTRQEIDEELFKSFQKLLDQLTPYYKSILDGLPVIRREVMDYLCNVSSPKSVGQIADEIVIDPNTASSALFDLKEAGIVNGIRRRREVLYEPAEPLMRLCKQVKAQRGHTIPLLVDLIRCWYSHDRLEEMAQSRELPDRLRDHVVEAQSASENQREHAQKVRDSLANLLPHRDRAREQWTCTQLTENEREHIAEKVFALHFKDVPFGPDRLVELDRKAEEFLREVEEQENVTPNEEYRRVFFQHTLANFLQKSDLLSNDRAFFKRSKTTTHVVQPSPSHVLHRLDDAYPRWIHDPLSEKISETPYRVLKTILDEVGEPDGPRVPLNNLNFDHEDLLRGLACSISLLPEERVRILMALPCVKQKQLNDLLKIFDEEQKKCKTLFDKKPAMKLWLWADQLSFKASWFRITVPKKAEAWLKSIREGLVASIRPESNWPGCPEDDAYSRRAVALGRVAARVDIDLALGLHEELLLQRLDSPAAWLIHGLEMLAVDRTVAAERIRNVISGWEVVPGVFREVALVTDRARLFDLAEEFARKAHGQNPDDGLCQLLLGRSLERDLDGEGHDDCEAEGFFEAAREKLPRWETDFEWYRFRGLIPDSEIPALETSPMGFRGRLALGTVLQRHRRFEEALAQFKCVTDEEPEELDGWRKLGHLFYELGRFRESLDCRDRELALVLGGDPPNPRDLAHVYNNRSCTLVELGRNAEALAVIDTCLDLVKEQDKEDQKSSATGDSDSGKPSNWAMSKSHYHHTRVEVLFAMGQMEDAIESLKTTFENFPPNVFRHAGDVEGIIGRLMLSGLTPEATEMHLRGLVDCYASNGAVGYLGRGLIRSLKRLEVLNEKTLDGWLEVWRNIEKVQADLQLSFRVFEVGIAYLKEGRKERLLDLPIEERKLLEDVFPEARIDIS